MNCQDTAISPRVFITGVLGGIGFNTAQYLFSQGRLTLLKSNISVVGVDNFHPLSAPIVHHQHQLSILRKNPNFIFHALDVRRIKDFISILQQINPTHLIHLAGASLSFPAVQPAKDILSDYLEVIRAVAVFSSETGLEVFRIGYRKTDSPAKVAEVREPLKSLSEIENKVETLLIEQYPDAKITSINLPALIGSGQSLNSFPVKQIWQLASLVSPRIPSTPETAECMGLFEAAKYLGNLILDTSLKDHLYDQPSNRDLILSQTHRVRTMDVFPQFRRWFPQKTEILQSPETWAYPSNDDILSTDDRWLSGQVDEIYQWLVHLPHFPSAKWYIKKKTERTEIINEEIKYLESF